MLTVFIRSACVGIAAVAFAAIGGTFIGIAIAMVIASRNPSPPRAPEVGWEFHWDLVATLHNHPGLARDLKLAALLVFVIGFTIGWRAFSGAKAERGPTR